MSHLLEGLNDQQREAVTTTEGPLLILAGAGSGKTKALTHRIAYLISQGLAAPHEILAVTFTNKAAKEMKERVASLVAHPSQSPQALGTFHSLGVRLLREQPTFHSRSHSFTIADAKDSEKLVRRALTDQGLSTRDWNPKNLKANISAAKNALKTPQDIEQTMNGPADEVLLRVYRHYEKLLATYNMYDFDDLILASMRMLEAHEQVRKSYQNRWRYLSIDEYQDTNALQEHFLTLLMGPEKNICVVGDDYQAIYSWRGANVDHILRFESRYPQCKTVYLTQNYRSTPHILSAANAIIAKNINQKHKELWTDKKTGDPVQLVAFSSERQEASWVRQQIIKYQEDGGSLKDCAILYRTNSQSRVFEEEFLTHRIPYSIIGGFRFYERKEIKDAVSFLQLWVNPSAYMSFARLADSYLMGIGPKTISKWEVMANNLNITLEQLLQKTNKPALRTFSGAFIEGRNQSFENVSDILRHLLKKSGYLQWLKAQDEGDERLENIEELLNVTSTYTDTAAFLEDAALLSDIDTLDEAQDRITCMTLHASKGLEFPSVFLVGCEEGLLPHINSIYEPDKLEEERRLFYVGMTRSKQTLHLTYATSRYTRGESVPQAPSQFLQHLPESVIRTEDAYNDVSSPYMDPIYSDPIIRVPTNTPARIMARQENMYITHDIFGKGIIIGTSNASVTCVFEGHGVKNIDIEAIENFQAT